MKNFFYLLALCSLFTLVSTKKAEANDAFKIRASGKCLDAQEYGQPNGANVQLWDCNGKDWQKWSLQDGEIKIRASGKCLDAQEYGQPNGANVQIWDCNGRDWQKWSRNSSVSNLLPELSGTRTGSKKRNMQGGFAEAKVTFYRNGSLVIESKALSESFTEGVKGAVFVVGLDQKGRALFASPKFDIPTACSKADFCGSRVTRNFNHTVGSELAKYVDKIDVYVDTRGAVGGFREIWTRTIGEACASYDELPNEAKNQIGFAGC